MAGGSAVHGEVAETVVRDALGSRQAPDAPVRSDPTGTVAAMSSANVVVVSGDPVGRTMAGPAIRAVELARVLAGAGHPVTLAAPSGSDASAAPVPTATWSGRDELAGLVADADAVVVFAPVLADHLWLADLGIPARRRRLRPRPARDARVPSGPAAERPARLGGRRLPAPRGPAGGRRRGAGGERPAAPPRARAPGRGRPPQPAGAGRGPDPRPAREGGAVRRVVHARARGPLAAAPPRRPVRARRLRGPLGRRPLPVARPGRPDRGDRPHRRCPGVGDVPRRAPPHPGRGRDAAGRGGTAAGGRARPARRPGGVRRPVGALRRAWRSGWPTPTSGCRSTPATSRPSSSFRTRILDYFWAGLPVVCTGGDVLADLVAADDLGIVVDPGDVGGLAAALDALAGADDAEREARRQRTASTAARLSWARAAEPLLEACATPRLAADRRVEEPQARGPVAALRRMVRVARSGGG